MIDRSRFISPFVSYQSKVTIAPSFAPTTTIVIHDEDTVEPSVEGSKLSTATIPAVVLGVASTVILVAALLYIMDSRRRVGTEKTREDCVDQDKHQSQKSVDRDTIAGSTTSDSGFYVHTLEAVCYEGSGNLILPPMTDGDNEDEDYPDDLSISRLSTMTESMVDGTARSDYSFGVVEGKLSSSSSVVTVLSHASRVSPHMDLASLMHAGVHSSPDSPYSSESSYGSSHDSALLGENLARSTHCTPIPFSSFFEYTPSAGKTEKGKETNEGSEHGEDRHPKDHLEHLIARIPFEEMANTPKVVREVQIAPVGEGGLGLHLGPAGLRGHPYVVALDVASPLTGRIFTGDRILIINGADTIGLSQGDASALLQIANCSNRIQMTVCSNKSGDAHSLSDGDDMLDSFDLGMPDSKIEV